MSQFYNLLSQQRDPTTRREQQHHLPPSSAAPVLHQRPTLDPRHQYLQQHLQQHHQHDHHPLKYGLPTQPTSSQPLPIIVPSSSSTAIPSSSSAFNSRRRGRGEAAPLLAPPPPPMLPILPLPPTHITAPSPAFSFADHIVSFPFLSNKCTCGGRAAAVDHENDDEVDGYGGNTRGYAPHDSRNSRQGGEAHGWGEEDNNSVRIVYYSNKKGRSRRGQHRDHVTKTPSSITRTHSTNHPHPPPPHLPHASFCLTCAFKRIAVPEGLLTTMTTTADGYEEGDGDVMRMVVASIVAATQGTDSADGHDNNIADSTTTSSSTLSMLKVFCARRLKKKVVKEVRKVLSLTKGYLEKVKVKKVKKATESSGDGCDDYSAGSDSEERSSSHSRSSSSPSSALSRSSSSSSGSDDEGTDDDGCGYDDDATDNYRLASVASSSSSTTSESLSVFGPFLTDVAKALAQWLRIVTILMMGEGESKKANESRGGDDGGKRRKETACDSSFSSLPSATTDELSHLLNEVVLIMWSVAFHYDIPPQVTREGCEDVLLMLVRGRCGRDADQSVAAHSDVEGGGRLFDRPPMPSVSSQAFPSESLSLLIPPQLFELRLVSVASNLLREWIRSFEGWLLRSSSSPSLSPSSSLSQHQQKRSVPLFLHTFYTMCDALCSACASRYLVGNGHDDDGLVGGGAFGRSNNAAPNNSTAAAEALVPIVTDAVTAVDASILSLSSCLVSRFIAARVVEAAVVAVWEKETREAMVDGDADADGDDTIYVRAALSRFWSRCRALSLSPHALRRTFTDHHDYGYCVEGDCYDTMAASMSPFLRHKVVSLALPPSHPHPHPHPLLSSSLLHADGGVYSPAFALRGLGVLFNNNGNGKASLGANADNAADEDDGSHRRNTTRFGGDDGIGNLTHCIASFSAEMQHACEVHTDRLLLSVSALVAAQGEEHGFDCGGGEEEKEVEDEEVFAASAIAPIRLKHVDVLLKSILMQTPTASLSAAHAGGGGIGHGGGGDSLPPPPRWLRKLLAAVESGNSLNHDTMGMPASKTLSSSPSLSSGGGFSFSSSALLTDWLFLLLSPLSSASTALRPTATLLFADQFLSFATRVAIPLCFASSRGMRQSPSSTFQSSTFQSLFTPHANGDSNQSKKKRKKAVDSNKYHTDGAVDGGRHTHASHNDHHDPTHTNAHNFPLHALHVVVRLYFHTCRKVLQAQWTALINGLLCPAEEEGEGQHQGREAAAPPPSSLIDTLRRNARNITDHLALSKESCTHLLEGLREWDSNIIARDANTNYHSRMPSNKGHNDGHQSQHHHHYDHHHDSIGFAMVACFAEIVAMEGLLLLAAGGNDAPPMPPSASSSCLLLLLKPIPMLDAILALKQKGPQIIEYLADVGIVRTLLEGGCGGASLAGQQKIGHAKTATDINNTNDVSFSHHTSTSITSPHSHFHHRTVSEFSSSALQMSLKALLDRPAEALLRLCSEGSATDGTDGGGSLDDDQEAVGGGRRGSSRLDPFSPNFVLSKPLVAPSLSLFSSTAAAAAATHPSRVNGNASFSQVPSATNPHKTAGRSNVNRGRRSSDAETVSSSSASFSLLIAFTHRFLSFLREGGGARSLFFFSSSPSLFSSRRHFVGMDDDFQHFSQRFPAASFNSRHPHSPNVHPTSPLSFIPLSPTDLLLQSTLAQLQWWLSASSPLSSTRGDSSHQHQHQQQQQQLPPPYPFPITLPTLLSMLEMCLTPFLSSSSSSSSSSMPSELSDVVLLSLSVLGTCKDYLFTTATLTMEHLPHHLYCHHHPPTFGHQHQRQQHAAVALVTQRVYIAAAFLMNNATVEGCRRQEQEQQQRDREERGGEETPQQLSSSPSSSSMFPTVPAASLLSFARLVAMTAHSMPAAGQSLQLWTLQALIDAFEGSTREGVVCARGVQLGMLYAEREGDGGGGGNEGEGEEGRRRERSVSVGGEVSEGEGEGADALHGQYFFDRHLFAKLMLKTKSKRSSPLGRRGSTTPANNYSRKSHRHTARTKKKKPNNRRVDAGHQKTSRRHHPPPSHGFSSRNNKGKHAAENALDFFLPPSVFHALWGDCGNDNYALGHRTDNNSSLSLPLPHSRFLPPLDNIMLVSGLASSGDAACSGATLAGGGGGGGERRRDRVDPTYALYLRAHAFIRLADIVDRSCRHQSVDGRDAFIAHHHDHDHHYNRQHRHRHSLHHFPLPSPSALSPLIGSLLHQHLRQGHAFSWDTLFGVVFRSMTLTTDKDNRNTTDPPSSSSSSHHHDAHHSNAHNNNSKMQNAHHHTDALDGAVQVLLLALESDDDGRSGDVRIGGGGDANTVHWNEEEGAVRRRRHYVLRRLLGNKAKGLEDVLINTGAEVLRTKKAMLPSQGSEVEKQLEKNKNSGDASSQGWQRGERESTKVRHSNRRRQHHRHLSASSSDSESSAMSATDSSSSSSSDDDSDDNAVFNNKRGSFFAGAHKHHQHRHGEEAAAIHPPLAPPPPLTPSELCLGIELCCTLLEKCLPPPLLPSTSSSSTSSAPSSSAPSPPPPLSPSVTLSLDKEVCFALFDGCRIAATGEAKREGRGGRWGRGTAQKDNNDAEEAFIASLLSPSSSSSSPSRLLRLAGLLAFFGGSPLVVPTRRDDEDAVGAMSPFGNADTNGEGDASVDGIARRSSLWSWYGYEGSEVMVEAQSVSSLSCSSSRERGGQPHPSSSPSLASSSALASPPRLLFFPLLSDATLVERQSNAGMRGGGGGEATATTATTTVAGQKRTISFIESLKASNSSSSTKKKKAAENDTVKQRQQHYYLGAKKGMKSNQSNNNSSQKLPTATANHTTLTTPPAASMIGVFLPMPSSIMMGRHNAHSPFVDGEEAHHHINRKDDDDDDGNTVTSHSYFNHHKRLVDDSGTDNDHVEDDDDEDTRKKHHITEEEERRAVVDAFVNQVTSRSALCFSPSHPSASMQDHHQGALYHSEFNSSSSSTSFYGGFMLFAYCLSLLEEKAERRSRPAEDEATRDMFGASWTCEVDAGSDQRDAEKQSQKKSPSSPSPPFLLTPFYASVLLSQLAVLAPQLQCVVLDEENTMAKEEKENDKHGRDVRTITDSFLLTSVASRVIASLALALVPSLSPPSASTSSASTSSSDAQHTSHRHHDVRSNSISISSGRCGMNPRRNQACAKSHTKTNRAVSNRGTAAAADCNNVMADGDNGVDHDVDIDVKEDEALVGSMLDFLEAIKRNGCDKGRGTQSDRMRPKGDAEAVINAAFPVANPTASLGSKRVRSESLPLRHPHPAYHVGHYPIRCDHYPILSSLSSSNLLPSSINAATAFDSSSINLTAGGAVDGGVLMMLRSIIAFAIERLSKEAHTYMRESMLMGGGAGEEEEEDLMAMGSATRKQSGGDGNDGEDDDNLFHRLSSSSFLNRRWNSGNAVGASAGHHHHHHQHPTTTVKTLPSSSSLSSPPASSPLVGMSVKTILRMLTALYRRYGECVNSYHRRGINHVTTTDRGSLQHQSSSSLMAMASPFKKYSLRLSLRWCSGNRQTALSSSYEHAPSSSSSATTTNVDTVAVAGGQKQRKHRIQKDHQRHRRSDTVGAVGCVEKVDDVFRCRGRGGGEAFYCSVVECAVSFSQPAAPTMMMLPPPSLHSPSSSSEALLNTVGRGIIEAMPLWIARSSGSNDVDDGVASTTALHHHHSRRDTKRLALSRSATTQCLSPPLLLSLLLTIFQRQRLVASQHQHINASITNAVGMMTLLNLSDALRASLFSERGKAKSKAITHASDAAKDKEGEGRGGFKEELSMKEGEEASTIIDTIEWCLYHVAEESALQHAHTVIDKDNTGGEDDDDPSAADDVNGVGAGKGSNQKQMSLLTIALRTIKDALLNADVCVSSALSAFTATPCATSIHVSSAQLAFAALYDDYCIITNANKHRADDSNDALPSSPPLLFARLLPLYLMKPSSLSLSSFPSSSLKSYGFALCLIATTATATTSTRARTLTSMSLPSSAVAGVSSVNDSGGHNASFSHYPHNAHEEDAVITAIARRIQSFFCFCNDAQQKEEEKGGPALPSLPSSSSSSAAIRLLLYLTTQCAMLLSSSTTATLTVTTVVEKEAMMASIRRVSAALALLMNKTLPRSQKSGAVGKIADAVVNTAAATVVASTVNVAGDGNGPDCAKDEDGDCFEGEDEEDEDPLSSFDVLFLKRYTVSC